MQVPGWASSVPSRLIRVSPTCRPGSARLQCSWEGSRYSACWCCSRPRSGASSLAHHAPSMLDVEAYRPEGDRAAGCVVARIADELIIGAQLHVCPLPWQLQPVIDLENLLMRVAQAPVSEEKSQAAGRQI